MRNLPFYPQMSISLSRIPQTLVSVGAALIVAIVLLSSYSNTFTAPPVLDDFHSFVDEPLLQDKSIRQNGFLRLVETKFGWTRCIPVLTFSWDLRLGGGELAYFHTTNLIIHILCFFSLLFLVFQIAEAPSSHLRAREILPPSWALAVWVAALWALNPVQTNAVTYLVQRMASLVTLFYAFSVATYVAGRSLHWRNDRVTAKAAFFYFLSFLGMALATLSKENSAMLPLMLLLTEAWFFHQDIFYRLTRFFFRHYLLLLGAAAVAFIAVAQVLPGILAGYDTRPFTLGERLLTEARVVIWYISLLFYPAPGRLSLEHDFQISRSLFDPPTTLPALFALVILVGWTFWRRRDFPLATYGILWFLVNLLLESTVVPLELVFEHRLYLPSMGLALSFTVLLHGLLNAAFHKRLPTRDLAAVNWCIIAILASVLALATFLRNEAWRDPLTFNRDNVAKAPLNPRAHANLATALSEDKHYESAIREARITIALAGPNYEQHCVAANAIVLSYSYLNQTEKALEEGTKLLEGLSPKHNVISLPTLYMNIATLHLKKKDHAKAFQALQNGVEVNLYLSSHTIDPGLADPATRILNNILLEASNMNLDLDGDGMADPGFLSAGAWTGRFLIDVGDRRAAENFLANWAAANPEDIDATLILEAARKWDEADLAQREKWEFHRKYVSHPFSAFNFNMAVALLICERNLPSPFSNLGEACLDYAMRLEPDSSDAHLLKGWYRHARGEFQEALAEGTRAVELDPQSAKAWLGIAFFQNSLNRREEAISSFRRTLEMYPGCPERTAIRGIIRRLEGKTAT